MVRQRFDVKFRQFARRRSQRKAERLLVNDLKVRTKMLD